MLYRRMHAFALTLALATVLVTCAGAQQVGNIRGGPLTWRSIRHNLVAGPAPPRARWSSRAMVSLSRAGPPS